MDGSEMMVAAYGFISKFSPIIFIVAVISVADLFITFLINLFKKLPTFGYNARRTK